MTAAPGGARTLDRAIASLWPDIGPYEANDSAAFAAYRADLDRRRRARAPTIYSLLIGLAAITELLEFIAFPERIVASLLAYGSFALICAATSWLLRHSQVPTARIIVSSNNLLVLCLLSYYVAVHGDAEVCALTLLLLMTGFVVLDVLDAPSQAASCVTAIIGFPLMLWLGVEQHIPLAYNIAAVLGGALVTTAGALVLDRQRAAAAIQRERISASEENLRGIFDNLQDIFFRVDRLGIIRMVSPSVARFGYRPEELIGADTRSFAPDASERGRINTLLIETTPTGEFELTLPLRDGRLVPVSVNARVMTDDSGEYCGIVGILRDISERKRTENRLRESEERARQHRAELAHVVRVSTMGEMAAGLAHEINQPLAAIVNYTRGAQHRLRAGTMETPALLATLEEISTLGLRAAEIVRRMRGFVRKQPTTYEWVDLNALVRDIGSLTEPEARQQTITVTYDLGTDLPAVRADRIQIEQVVLNLMRNGIEAMERSENGQRALTVTTRPSPGDAVEVAIADTGLGLTAEECAQAFEPFFTTKTNGLGLGLAISRSIVEAHGGQLWATSHVGCGATFHFRLERNPLSVG